MKGRKVREGYANSMRYIGSSLDEFRIEGIISHKGERRAAVGLIASLNK